jgi:hypothetical protein
MASIAATLGGKVTFAGLDPLRPTVLKTGAAAAADAIASAILWRQCGGRGAGHPIGTRTHLAVSGP